MLETTPLRTSYDAIVVGARCAGAATAMLLARRGLRVLAVDRSRYGADTLSTHALMRPGVLQLHRWGVLDAIRASGAPPLRRTAFHYGDDEIVIPIKARDGVDALYSPRRTVLDAALVDAARDAGAEVVHGVTVSDLVRDADGRVAGIRVEQAAGGARRITAGIVIGADGRFSTVARRVGAEDLLVGCHATGVVFGYFAGLGADTTHWYYRPGVGAGVIPTNDGAACVFAAVPAERYRDEVRADLAGGFRRILSECDPALEAAVAAADRVGGLRAHGGAVGHLRRSWGPGWALVGDAAYFKDPITAHGMTDALRDAELLARAVARGTDAALAGYQAVRDELSTRFMELTEEVASCRWTLAELQQVHLEMSREMRREEEALLGLDSDPVPFARTA